MFESCGFEPLDRKFNKVCAHVLQLKRQFGALSRLKSP